MSLPLALCRIALSYGGTFFYNQGRDMTRILSIDPGTEQSAFCWYDSESRLPDDFGIICNRDLMLQLKKSHPRFVVCELIQCQGMPVGKETFETAYFIGRIMESQFSDRNHFFRVYRSDVKLHLCGSMKAKDPNVRQALIDKYGGNTRVAIGLKKTPGPLYGISSHIWSALALAVTWCEAEQFEAQRSVLDQFTRTDMTY